MGRVKDMVIVVCELYERGFTETEICKKLGLTMEWVKSALAYYYELMIEL